MIEHRLLKAEKDAGTTYSSLQRKYWHLGLTRYQIQLATTGEAPKGGSSMKPKEEEEPTAETCSTTGSKLKAKPAAKTETVVHPKKEKK